MLDGYIFFVAAGLTTALAILWRPAETAGILLLFAPVIWGLGATDIQLQTQGAAPPNVAIAVSGVATLMYGRFMLQPQKPYPLKWLRIASIMYCLATLPSVFLSESSLQSLGGYVRLISPVIFMFALLQGSRPQGVHTFQFKALALATVSLLGIIVAAQYAGKGSYSLGGFDRLRAFNLSPQLVSVYSVAGLGVLVCGVLLGRRRYVYVYVIVMVALITCTYLTGYRTAWIGMAVLIAVAMLSAVRSRFAKVVALLAVFGLLPLSGVVIQSLARYTHENETISTDTLNAITSGRITTDLIALDRYIAGNPTEWLFGNGVYSSEDLTLQEQGVGYGVHNDFLAMLTECGVVGLAGYLFLLVMLGWILLRVRYRLPQQCPAWSFLSVGWASFVAFAVMGISGALYTNVFVGWYYYGFIGFTLAQLKAASPCSGQVLSHRYGMEMPLSTKAMSPARLTSERLVGSVSLSNVAGIADFKDVLISKPGRSRRVGRLRM